MCAGQHPRAHGFGKLKHIVSYGKYERAAEALDASLLLKIALYPKYTLLRLSEYLSTLRQTLVPTSCKHRVPGTSWATWSGFERFELD